MRSLIPESIEQAAMEIVQEIAPIVYHMRSGLRPSGVLSDDEIRERMVESFNRSKKPQDDPSRWFEQESAAAGVRLGIQMALDLPDSSPRLLARLMAENYRKQLRGDLEIPQNRALLEVDRDSFVLLSMHAALDRLNGVSVFGGNPPGPIFRVAYMNRCDEIIQEETRETATA